MGSNMDWNSFCELYYESARRSACVKLESLRKRLGGFNRLVDEAYVIDCAVLAALEKTYARYDSTRGFKVTTLLSTIVGNEVVDCLEAESKAASVKCDLETFREGVRQLSEQPSEETREKLLAMLTDAIRRLSPSDQVILDYYLADKSSYVALSSAALGVSENYVCVRRLRIFDMLPKLMNLTGAEYAQMCYQSDGTVLADSPAFAALDTRAYMDISRPSLRTGGVLRKMRSPAEPSRPAANPIREVSVRRMAESLLAFLE